MKIGILTLPFNVNYGGILQAYAMQSYLNSKGHQVVFINRVPGRPDIVVVFKRLLSLCKCLFKKYVLLDKSVVISNPFAKIYLTKKYDDLDWGELRRFVSENLHVSHALDTTNRVRSWVISNQIDCIIVGSDQVWRDCYSPNVYNYFCDFVIGQKDIKKIAYAASFGVLDKPIPDYKLHKCIKLCRCFNNVSVREDSAIHYMEKVFGIRPEKVIDPTLLLTASDYSPFLNVETLVGEKYIACYILNMTDEKMKIVELVRARLGLKLRIISSEPQFNDTPFAPSIEQWLTTLACSDFVVTDSYHGSLFSIQFHRQFLAITNLLRGNDRFISILSDLGLEDRLVDSMESAVNSLEEITDINYSIVDSKLQKARCQAELYLNACLQSNP